MGDLDLSADNDKCDHTGAHIEMPHGDTRTVVHVSEPVSASEAGRVLNAGPTMDTSVKVNGSNMAANNKSHKPDATPEAEEEAIDLKQCGCGTFRPEWLQRFRTPIVFLINYSLMGILRGAYFHYTISSLSTIEKRYAFPSRLSSIILIADNVSSMIINPLVGYLGTRVNGPKLIGCGLILCACSSIMSGLPYFIYGPSTHLLTESDLELDPTHAAMLNLHGTSGAASVAAFGVIPTTTTSLPFSSSSSFSSLSPSTPSPSTLSSIASSSSLSAFLSSTSSPLSSSSSSSSSPLSRSSSKFSSSVNHGFCGTDANDCKTNSHPFQLGAFMFLVAASFVNGIGYSGFWTIGLPYLDDNVKRSNSPIYISISTVIRMLGVTVGYFVSSYSLSLYEDPRLKPKFATNDPRWVGAWWLGFIAIGVLMFIFTLPFFMFPPSMKKPVNRKQEKHLSFTDAFKVFKKLCRNPILVMDTIGGAVRFIGFAGYWINKPRYIEAQFNQSAARSSLLTGATSIVMKAVGILLGGIFMSKCRPSPRVLVSLIVIVEMTCNCLMFSAMFVGCPSPKFEHISYEQRKMVPLECSKDCNCNQAVFQPVCSSDGLTNYFSPCYAGCDKSSVNQTSDGKTLYHNCRCDKGPMTSGYCQKPPEEQCDSLATYLIILSLTGVISSFARTPNIMIAMRSVDKNHKSFALGVVESFFSIFCYIPYPVLFSLVTDAACIVWESSCGKNGNCWLYDLTKFRYLLHGTSVAFMCVGTVFDIGIWLYADRLKGLYDEDEDDVPAVDDPDAKTNKPPPFAITESSNHHPQSNQHELKLFTEPQLDTKDTRNQV